MEKLSRIQLNHYLKQKSEMSLSLFWGVGRGTLCSTQGLLPSLLKGHSQ